MMDISIDVLIRLLLEQMQSETAPEQSDKEKVGEAIMEKLMTEGIINEEK